MRRELKAYIALLSSFSLKGERPTERVPITIYAVSSLSLVLILVTILKLELLAIEYRTQW